VISRVADHCFWFGRYLDRAESTARLLQSTRTMVFDAGIPVTQCWQPLVIVSGAFPAFKKRYGETAGGDGEAVQRYMTWDEDNIISLIRSVGAARENARVIRDALSEDVWQEVNGLYHFLRDGSGTRQYDQDREGFYVHVRRGVQLCLGVVRSTMLHEEPMSFLWLGVMLERIGQLARILDMHHHTMEQEHLLESGRSQEQSIVEEALWLALLRACSGFDAFRKKHQGRVTVGAMVSFLVYEEKFPRSLFYGLRAASRILAQIWPEGSRPGSRPASASSDASGAGAGQRLEDLMAWLAARRERVGEISIHEVLTRVVDETTMACREIADEIREGVAAVPARQSQSQS
jgi:uncharacterized alpha-E superfamily protein